MSDKNKVVYLSLPMTGYDMKCVAERCKQLKERFQRDGYEIVCPLDIISDNGADYLQSYGFYMGLDIEFIIDKADMLIFDKGYTNSKGCLLEYRCAQLYSKPIMVIDEIDDTLSHVDC